MSAGVRVRIRDRDLRDEEWEKMVADIVETASREVTDLVAAYPPEGPWNRPRREKPWYQRHFGPRWYRADGSIGGRNTSELLQKSWKRRAARDQARIWTNVTYAPYLLDEARQVHWARSHGWKTTKEIAARWERERLARVVEDALRKMKE